MDEQDFKAAGQAGVAVAHVASSGLKLKAGAVLACLFMIGLIVLGIAGPSVTTSAADCQDTGAGTGSTVTGSSSTGDGSLTRQQISNAQAIDAVAARDGLPGRATLIALMTALQESTLLNNATKSDHDSLGLFQQRPSMGWGTPAQILDVDFATESFLHGRGTNPGLVQITGWQTLPLGQVAQDVQKSLYPNLYAGQESKAREIADKAGINLERAGTTTSGSSASGDPVSSTATGGCQPASVSGGTPGAVFSDGSSSWVVHNPRTPDQAVAYAIANSGDNSTGSWYRLCLSWAATVYGWHVSGVATAMDEWNVIPATLKHPGDRHPPPGALLFWSTSHPAGHIAVYVGGGRVSSNDILRAGYIDLVPANEIESRWGAHYLGWAVPDFPHGS